MKNFKENPFACNQFSVTINTKKKKSQSQFFLDQTHYRKSFYFSHAVTKTQELKWKA